MVRLHPLYYFDTHFCYVVVVVVVLAPTLFLFQTLLGRWRQDEHVPFPSLDSFHAFVLLVRSPEDHHPAFFASVRIVVVVVVSRDTFRLRRRDDGVQRRCSKDDAEHDAPDEKPGDFVRGWQSERQSRRPSFSSSPPPSYNSMHTIIARTHHRRTTNTGGGGGGVRRAKRRAQQQQRHDGRPLRTL